MAEIARLTLKIASVMPFKISHTFTVSKEAEGIRAMFLEQL